MVAQSQRKSAAKTALADPSSHDCLSTWAQPRALPGSVTVQATLHNRERRSRSVSQPDRRSQCSRTPSEDAMRVWRGWGT